MVLIGIPDIFDKLPFFNGKITDLLRFIHNPDTIQIINTINSFINFMYVF